MAGLSLLIPSLTEKRDLRSGLPLWRARTRPHFRHDRVGARPIFDAVVVGTGISGALVADALLLAGLSVVAVDRRSPVTGATPASTALIQFELDTPLAILEKKVGTRRAGLAWFRSLRAVHALGNRVLDLGIECDWQDTASIYLPGDVLNAAGLKREADLRQRSNLCSRYVSRAELQTMAGIKAGGAIVSSGNAGADPLKLTAGLWRSFQNRGGKIVWPFDVTGLEETRGSARITSSEGVAISAKNVVFCTGYEFPEFYKPKGLTIVSTWALATKQQPARLWPGRQLIWQAADPYLYMRPTADGRVIAGGEDEEFAGEEKRDALLHEKTKAIGRKVARMFPGIDAGAEYAWTGNFGGSETGMPVIERMKGFRRSYAVMGFGGNGITFSMLAAQIMARTLGGAGDPDMDVFSSQ